jgi:hypothetical protein
MSEDRLLQTRRAALFAALAAGTGAALASSVRAAPVGLAAPTGDVHDFDYHLGAWTAVNRRLKQRWTSTPEWEEFPGETRYVGYLDGMVSVDETSFPTKGWAGLTVRVFHAGTRQWSIYWISSRDGTLGSPMVGGFQGERGLFYGDDTDDGRPVKVRFIRTKRPPDRERWEQAFSRDGGESWETNWTADFTRVKA